jgi:hypothetical protein
VAIVSVGEPVIGFITKNEKVLKATLIGADISKKRTVVLYEEDNALQVSDNFKFYTQRFAAEVAVIEAK